MKELLVASVLCILVCICEPACDTLITDFSQENCIAMQTNISSYYYWLDEQKSCIPGCAEYARDGYLGKSCPCVPGYKCVHRCKGTVEAFATECTTDADCQVLFSSRTKCVETCVGDSNTCMAYHANTTDFVRKEFTAQKFKPSCQNDGLWKSKQCKGGVAGRCMCYDAHGTRLFGEAAYSKSEDMTCACSRRKANLIAAGRSYVSFHCNSVGNYEQLQCDSGLCWCAEEKTGELTSAVVPEKAMTKLPCYDVTKIGIQYLRKCDSVTYAMSKIEQILKKHGVVNVNMGVRMCDGDGAYGAFNVSDGLAYCTWRDGTKIGTWQSDSGTDIGTLNCNCARDFKRYNHILTCQGNGNYREYQSYIKNMQNYYYCVDNDGFQKTDVSTERLDNCTLYY